MCIRDSYKNHDVEVVIDKLVVTDKDDTRLVIPFTSKDNTVFQNPTVYQITVSYTHLRVLGPLRTQLDGQPVYFIHKFVVITVSYTHLDVYKRQLLFLVRQRGIHRKTQPMFVILFYYR